MSHNGSTQPLVERGQPAPVPNPEVLPRAKRRQFSAEYKMRIVEEADRVTKRGEIGALLRREGLYSSHLDKWRTLRARGQLGALSATTRGRKPRDSKEEEIERLRQENERLRARLEQAELIIDVQKKLSLLLGLTTDESQEDESK
jgi:transposase